MKVRDDMEVLIRKSDVLKSLMQYVEDKKTIGQCIDECETIVPKTGHWIAYGKIWKCSNCEELSCCKGKYCPDCGVKMESEG